MNTGTDRAEASNMATALVGRGAAMAAPFTKIRFFMPPLTTL